jgi:Viral BACON domain
MPASQLTVAGGRATAVWEVTLVSPAAIDTVTFPVWIVFPAGSTPSGSLTVDGAFAPNPDDGAFPYSVASTEQSSSLPIPRFVSLSTLVQPSSLTLQYTKAVAGASPTAPVTGVVSLSGSEPLPFSATVSSAGPLAWLSVAPTTGVSGSSVTVTADGSALQPGTYTGTVAFTFSNGNITIVPVQLVVTEVSLTASAGSGQTSLVNSSYGTPLSVMVIDQNGNPVSGQAVTFTGPSAGAGVSFLAASQTDAYPASAAKASRPVRSYDSPGLTATAMTNAQGVATIGVRANGIGGTFSVTAAIAGLTVTFTLTNLAPAPPASVPLNAQIDPAFLVLQYVKAPAGVAPTTPTVATLNVSGAFSSSYRASLDAEWLSLTPTTGITSRVVTISANGSALQPGIYSTAVTFTFGDGTTIAVPVQLMVIGPPLFKASVTALTFFAQAGSTTVQTQSFNIQSAGANFTAALTLTDIQGGGGSWLTVSPSSISTAAAVQATMNPAGLAAGVYQKNIVATASGVGNSPFVIPVTLTVAAPPPAPGVTGVVNAASFATGPYDPETFCTSLLHR